MKIRDTKKVDPSSRKTVRQLLDALNHGDVFTYGIQKDALDTYVKIGTKYYCLSRPNAAPHESSSFFYSSLLTLRPNAILLLEGDENETQPAKA